MVINAVINSDVSFPVLAVMSDYISQFSGKQMSTSPLLPGGSFTFS